MGVHEVYQQTSSHAGFPKAFDVLTDASASRCRIRFSNEVIADVVGHFDQVFSTAGHLCNPRGTAATVPLFECFSRAAWL